MHQFLEFIFGIKLYMFRTVPLYIIRGFSLYTQQWCMSHRFVESVRAGSGRNQFRPDPKFRVPLYVYSLKYTRVIRIDVISCMYVYVGETASVV